jgi:GNAT superfamily N-acetyltransferase
MEAVRAATNGDSVRLVELAEELVGGVISQRGGSLLVDPQRLDGSAGGGGGGFEALLGDPGSRVVVGTLDDSVVGFAVSHVEDGGVLDACYVEPEARGVGVGRLLLDAVLSWLGERGCESVDGTALPGDREAKNFYESAGFKARMLTMHRQLG